MPTAIARAKERLSAPGPHEAIERLPAAAAAASEDELCRVLARAGAAEALEWVLPAIQTHMTYRGQWRAFEAAGRAGGGRALEVLVAAMGPRHCTAAVHGAIRAQDVAALKRCLALGGAGDLPWLLAGRSAAQAGGLPVLRALERLLPPAAEADYRAMARRAARHGHAGFARHCLARAPDAVATACFAAYGGHWALADELRAGDAAMGPHLLAYAAAGGQLAIVRHLHEAEGVPLIGQGPGAAVRAAGHGSFHDAHYLWHDEDSGTGWKYHRAVGRHPAPFGAGHAGVLAYCLGAGALDAERLLRAGIRSARAHAVQLAFQAGAPFHPSLLCTAAGTAGFEMALRLYRPGCAACLREAAGELRVDEEYELAAVIAEYLEAERRPDSGAECCCPGAAGA